MVQAARLPGTSEGAEQVVCHVDMDCFYAACERLREPKLRGEPVVVGMGYEDGETHGAVATASYEAREHGVESAQAISEALERLPRRDEGARDATDVDSPDSAGSGEDLPEDSADEPEATAFYRPVDMDYYQSVAADVKEILHDRADVVREVSIDEAYLDVSDRVDWADDPGAFARELKAEIREDVGVTASVGVAPTMSCAKIASDHEKPDGLVVVEPGDVADFLAPLPVEAVHGVGPVTAGELRDLGVETAGDLAGADLDEIESRFGERGTAIYRYARGEDTRVVEPMDDPKSLSRESSFAEAVEDPERITERLRALATAVSERAARKGALYQTIGIKVVTPPYDVNTRARSLPGPVDDPDLLEEVSLSLFDEFEGERVRKVGVRVANLDFAAGDQADLGGWGDASAGGDAGAPPEKDIPRTHRGQVTLAEVEAAAAGDGAGDESPDDGQDDTEVDDESTPGSPRGSGNPRGQRTFEDY